MCLRALILVLAASVGFAQGVPPSQLFNEALAAQQRGDLNAAIAGYERLLKASPRLVPARINLAAAYTQLGSLDKAAENYRIVLQQTPGNVQAATLLGNCLVLQQDYDGAVKLLEPVEKSHPKDLDVAFILGEALLHTSRVKEGLKRIERVAAARNDAEAWMLAGMTHLKLGDYAQARNSLDKGLQLDPSMPGAYTLSGMAKSRTGDEEAAKADYQKAVQMDQNDFEANLRLGSLLRRQGDIDAAKFYLGHAMKLDASSLLARYQMAQAESASNNDAAAVRLLENIANEAPNVLKVHVQLAALYYRLHRPEDGARERQIVDRLLAEPDKQDYRLDADPTLDAPLNAQAPSQ